MKYWHDVKTVIALAYRDIERKHLPLAAAGLAFYFQMSLFPALLLVAAVMTYLPEQNGGATSFLAHVIPQQGVAALENLLVTIRPHRTGLLSFGIITTLWLTSIGSKGIIASLDIVYNVRAPRPLWMNRILAVVLTIVVGLLLLLAVGLTLLGPAFEGLLESAVSIQSLWLRIWPYLHWFVAATFTFGAIELLYLLAPNVSPSRRLTVPGAVVAAAIWLALSRGLGFLFHIFGTRKIEMFYGIPTTLIALIVWVYWSANAILIGAQINVSLQHYKSPVSSDEEAA